MNEIAQFAFGASSIILANAFGLIVRIPFRIFLAAADVDDKE